jgi:hypothetical protein
LKIEKCRARPASSVEKPSRERTKSDVRLLTPPRGGPRHVCNLTYHNQLPSRVPYLTAHQGPKPPLGPGPLCASVAAKRTVKTRADAHQGVQGLAARRRRRPRHPRTHRPPAHARRNHLVRQQRMRRRARWTRASAARRGSRRSARRNPPSRPAPPSHPKAPARRVPSPPRHSRKRMACTRRRRRWWRRRRWRWRAERGGGGRRKRGRSRVRRRGSVRRRERRRKLPTSAPAWARRPGPHMGGNGACHHACPCQWVVPGTMCQAGWIGRGHGLRAGVVHVYLRDQFGHEPAYEGWRQQPARHGQLDTPIRRHVKRPFSSEPRCHMNTASQVK